MKVVIIDDDDIVRMSLKMIIEASGLEVAAMGKSGEDAVSLFMEYKPDVLLSDIRMEGKDGIDAAKEILEKEPQAKILFLTTFSDDEYVISALKFGVKGYILKQDFEGIVPALMAVNSGQSVFGGEIVSKIESINRDNAHQGEQAESIANEVSRELREKQWAEKNEITPKEMEIIRLIVEGMNNKEIADTLFLSEGTVRNYLSNILDKLNLRDRTQLVVYYYKTL